MNYKFLKADLVDTNTTSQKSKIEFLLKEVAQAEQEISTLKNLISFNRQNLQIGSKLEKKSV